jgi:carboxyl-terminal processing protease
VVLEWGDLPVSDAVEKTPYFWAEGNPATLEGRRRLRLRFVTRAPVGASVRVRSRRQGGTSEERTLVATAEPEPPRPSQGAEILFGCAVSWRSLDDGLGYVLLKHELPTPRCVAPEEELGRAIAAFQGAGARGLILDLRGNFGGEDLTAARFLGFFLKEERVYEQVGLLDRGQRRFLPRPGVDLKVRPTEPQWRGPLALLVDGETVSSGEGLPLHLKGRENVVIVGREGTHGSFAINQKSVHLPGGLTFGFPEAQSLDAAGRVQVDSDASGRGGIQPDIRIARDEATLEAERNGRDIVLERAREVLLRP